LSNFKNALKSGGSGIAAIEELAGQFNGFEAFVGCLAAPIAFLVGALLVERDHRESPLIQGVGHDRSRY
jgi:hypothetical protein